jgi:hypothetical protein
MPAEASPAKAEEYERIIGTQGTLSKGRTPFFHGVPRPTERNLPA